MPGLYVAGGIVVAAYIMWATFKLLISKHFGDAAIKLFGVLVMLAVVALVGYFFVQLFPS